MCSKLSDRLLLQITSDLNGINKRLGHVETLTTLISKRQIKIESNIETEQKEKLKKALKKNSFITISGSGSFFGALFVILKYLGV